MIKDHITDHETIENNTISDQLKKYESSMNALLVNIHHSSQ